jgi:hypothetical protein
MKLKIAFICSITVVCLSIIASAAAKPDFSGTWVLDKDRSFSNPAGLEQTMTVVQTGDQIKVESKVKTQQGEQTINEAFSLDGKEGDFTPPAAQPGATGKRKASWLADAKHIIVEDVVTSDSPKGPVTRRVTRKWSLSPDGATLTVDYFFDDQRGSFEAKRVFVKK